MDYYVSFIGHILEEKRQKGWPREITHDVIIRSDSFDGLKELINKEMWSILVQQGMIINNMPQEMINDNIETLSRRVYIHLHMISHITTKIVKLAGEVPDENKEVILQ